MVHPGRRHPDRPGTTSAPSFRDADIDRGWSTLRRVQGPWTIALAEAGVPAIYGWAGQIYTSMATWHYNDEVAEITPRVRRLSYLVTSYVRG